jgi:rhodanese-related sulfurtransferase
VLGLEGLATAMIEVPTLRERLANAGAVVIDLDISRRYAQGHIPGAWFARRSCLADVVAKLEAGAIVLTSPDDRLARLAASEITPPADVPVMVLAGGTEAWRHAGLPVETGASHMASEANDVVLSARERRKRRGASTSLGSASARSRRFVLGALAQLLCVWPSHRYPPHRPAPSMRRRPGPY